MRIDRCWVIIFFFFLSIADLGAQTCVNCKEIPKIVSFDFDNRVPRPDSSNGSGSLWPEWKNLFLIAGSISSQVANNEPGCIKIIVPPSVDTGGLQLISVGGETFTNLPSNPLISADLSDYGDYLLTGTISSQNSSCQLHVELQASCNRQLVASAEISFPLSSVVGNVSNIARQVVTQLSPLSEKIRSFELRERQNDRSLTLFQTNWEEPILVTVQKKILKAGESTSFTIELKDCDGFPLAGREIFFNKTEFEGFKINGTIGGTVSPTKLITDMNGKATGNFTLKPGAKEAWLAAYSPGKNVKGCESMLFGDATINIKKTYSGFISYRYKSNANCQRDNQDKIMHHHSSGTEQQVVEYRASFYINQEGSGVMDVSFGDEDEVGNHVPGKMEAGSYNYKKTDYWKSTIICECVSKGEVTEQSAMQSSTGGLKSGHFRFAYSEEMGLVNLFLVFNSKNKSSFSSPATGSQTSSSEERTEWPVNFDTLIDKGLTIKKEKSGNQTKYIAEGQRNVDKDCLHQSEKIKVVIMEE